MLEQPAWERPVDMIAAMAFDTGADFHYQKEAAVVLWQAFKPQIVVEQNVIVPSEAWYTRQ